MLAVVRMVGIGLHAETPVVAAQWQSPVAFLSSEAGLLAWEHFAVQT